MTQQKLGRKDYSIAVKTGTDANKTKFKRRLRKENTTLRLTLKNFT